MFYFSVYAIAKKLICIHRNSAVRIKWSLFLIKSIISRLGLVYL